MPDIFQILEEVQMVRVDIEDHADLRLETQETVGIFTGFRDKILGASHTDIAADLLQDAANGYSRIKVGLQQDAGQHGRGRGLAVSPGDGSGIAVIRHDLSEQLRPRQHGDAHLNRPCVFRVVRMNCRGIHHDVCV